MKFDIEIYDETYVMTHEELKARNIKGMLFARLWGKGDRGPSYFISLESEQEAFKFVSEYRDICGFNVLRNGEIVFSNEPPKGVTNDKQTS
ncbi:MAG: hypothetical protein HC840_10450 [Leptolyngbyaceae cyanobacterium RM2_2_4]|nr:hypothetical protein [Leptolyngbyaceae cyanobacterium RM2_2_4]